MVESPEYITNGLVTFHFTSSSHTTTATYNVGTTQTYAQVSNVQLNVATTYSVYASCTATNGTAVTSSSTSLTTAAAATAKPTESWLELPAEDTNGLYPNAQELKVKSGGERNYTAYYDKSTYTSMWTAYPLQSKHMGSLSRPSKWYFNTEIGEEYQVDLTDSSYEGDTYSRGHLIPNASRNGISEMQQQTFYVTNSVPQVQNSFNSGIWSSLEGALQSMAKGGETLYIVTGVAFKKVGETKSVSYIQAKDDNKKYVENTTSLFAIPLMFYCTLPNSDRYISEITAMVEAVIDVLREEYSKWEKKEDVKFVLCNRLTDELNLLKRNYPFYEKHLRAPHASENLVIDIIQRKIRDVIMSAPEPEDYEALLDKVAKEFKESEG